jgi:hypothetical protein
LNTKALIAFVLLLGFAATALADNDKGLYVGAGVGYFRLKAESVQGPQPITGEFDSDDVSFKAFAGWRFNQYLAAELDYIDFGKPNEDVSGVEVNASINGVAPYLVGTLPLGPLELFAKAGYLFYDLRVEVADQKVSSVSGDQDDLIYGAGLGITLFGRLNARLEYETIDVSGAVRHADAVWLSGAWRF